MSAEFPTLAISVRQPWAWAIIYAGKDIENRGQAAVRYGIGAVGRRAVHAAKGMTRVEYEMARDFMAAFGVVCPAPADLLRGGIIGSVDVTGVTSKSLSPWFMGPRGLMLKDAKPCEFVPSVGALGLFKWAPAAPSIVPAPARWMLEPKLEPAPACSGAVPAALPLFGEE